MQRVALVATVVFLGACATAKATREAAELKQWLDAEWAHSRFDTVRDRIALDPVNATARQLSDSSFPSPEQQPALAEFDQLATDFNTRLCSILARSAPYMVPARVDLQIRYRTALAALMSENLTFGDFNRLNATSASMALQEMQRVQMEWRGLAVAEQQARAQSALATLGQIAAVAAVAAPKAPAARYTNCYWQGNTMQCTTQ